MKLDKVLMVYLYQLQTSSIKQPEGWGMQLLWPAVLDIMGEMIIFSWSFFFYCTSMLDRHLVFN